MANSLNELPFHLACRHGEEMVKVFIPHAMRFDYNAVTILGDTPLHIVCRNMSWHAESVIKLLLDKFKCNVGVGNKQKELPLHIACQHNDISSGIIDKLAAPLSAVQLSSQNESGDTALHTLLKSSCGKYQYQKVDLPVVQVLIKRVPLLTICSAENSDSLLPIHLASHYETFPVIKCLHEVYTLHSVQLPPFLLHEACYNSDQSVLNYIIKNCSNDINIPNAEGDLPIHLVLGNKQAIASTYSIIKRTENISQQII